MPFLRGIHFICMMMIVVKTIYKYVSLSIETDFIFVVEKIILKIHKIYLFFNKQKNFFSFFSTKIQNIIDYKFFVQALSFRKDVLPFLFMILL